MKVLSDKNITPFVNFLKNKFALKTHYHEMSALTSGVVPEARGGTNHTRGLAWVLLGTFSSTNSLTINLTNYNEVMIVARFASKLVSTTVPKPFIGTTTRELWIGGGKSANTTANGGALRALVNITSTRVTGVATNSGSTVYTSSTTWYVYAR